MSLIGALVGLEASLLKVRSLALQENKEEIISAIDYLYPKVGEMINAELNRNPIQTTFTRSKR